MIISNLRGESERIRIADIKPLKADLAKQYLLSNQQVKLTFPVFICDLLMIIDRRGIIHNVEVFRAILNGYKIDKVNTQTPSSENDDDLVEK